MSGYLLKLEELRWASKSSGVAVDSGVVAKMESPMAASLPGVNEATPGNGGGSSEVLYFFLVLFLDFRSLGVSMDSKDTKKCSLQ